MTARLLAAALLLSLTAACHHQPSTEFNPTPYQNRVCDLLNLNQLAPFHITQPGTPSTDTNGSSCRWTSPETTITVTFNFFLNPFAPPDYTSTINGIPSLHDEIPGNGVQLACATTIDNHHNESITVVVSTPHAPCSASDTIAGLVIDTARATR